MNDWQLQKSPKYKMTEIDLSSLILILFIIQDDQVPIMAADVFVMHGDKASAIIIEIELVLMISGDI